MAKSVKELLESVDSAHKGWSAVMGLATAASPFLIPSKRLATFMAAGALVGGLLGYYFCISNWSGKGRDRCLGHRKNYWVVIPFAICPAVILYALLQPAVAKWSSAFLQINSFLLDVMIFVNLSMALFTAIVAYALVASIAISSPKLWEHTPKAQPGS
jgi:hypothetical protein